MFKLPLTSNKVSIAKKSSGNFVVQESNINNLMVCNSTPDLIKTMGDIQQYDAIQRIISDCMSAAKLTHPLRPHFTAKYNSQLEKLVSTPETEDAFKIYPKKIKGTFLLDYKKYPHMDGAETPWEYAYRTQTKVELKTTAYKEYLGEREDPFPITTYSDGMVTVIVPPPFPEAVEATISSGDVSVPILLRRKPCMEYGQMVFGTITNDCGFDITLIAYRDFEKTDFKITKCFDSDISVQVQREKLINSIQKTKHIKISIGTQPLLDANFNEDELTADIFSAAPLMIQYLENLSAVETHLGCRFDLSNGDIDMDDFRMAYVLASSLQGKWHCQELDFDDEIRCDYDKIPEEILDSSKVQNELSISRGGLVLQLQGQAFSIEKYIIAYTGARINNLASIVKNRKKKRKRILFTLRPIVGERFFCKYHKFEGISIAEQ